MASKKIQALAVEKLHTYFDPKRISWEDSSKIPRSPLRKPAQTRALNALQLALKIKNNGYNVYLAGDNNLGRSYMVTKFLAPLAKKLPTPPDLLYVKNFEEKDKPLLLKVPAGQGRQLKNDLYKTFMQIKKEIPSRFETDIYEKKKAELLNDFQIVRQQLFKEMDDLAAKRGFKLDMDEQGSLTLYPLVDGKRLAEEDYDHIDPKLRRSLKQKGDKLLQDLSPGVRKLSLAEREYKNSQKDLERDVVRDVLDRFLTPFVEKSCKQAGEYHEALQNHFKAVREDILDSIDIFVQKENINSFPLGDFSNQAPQENILLRYEINLFVDNSKTKGAPIIRDFHPNYANLLGCVERESEMGALVTNFTLIKAGSLQKAQGGYLVLNTDDLLSNPASWDGLIRALRSSSISIEDIADGLDLVRTKGIQPEALPLDVKVILVGQNETYENLLDLDDRFAKLFKMKAQMSAETERTAANIKAWLPSLADITDEAELLPFDREAMAALVDYATFLCEDHRKISLKFPLVREAMIEASAYADMNGETIVGREAIQKALAERMYRAAYIEELFMEEYDRDIIKIQTSGTAIGRVNGLSVTFAGQFEFGLPHQISCTVGVGHGGIIDLEREAELGGPIHTKAMMILKSYLVDQFAQDKPLVLTGSLCFEQSYSGIEGDSASGAELVSLLSAIAQAPVNLSLAITGAVSQAGAILPVGGVTRKIEGFFNLCERRGLTGEQGVIIPKDNVEHLMLNQRVRDAVAEKKFSIYAVSHITEALELLTGMPAGKRRKNGSYAENTLFHAVDMQLHELGWYAENSYKVRKRKKKDIKKTSKKENVKEVKQEV